MNLYTIGHSNRTMEDFLIVLKSHGIEQIIDVRRFPGSKKFPHFNKENLEKVFPENGIKYFHLGEKLGGFRKGGYEAYTKTEDFKEGLEEVLEIGKGGKTAIMCAELVFFRCHRRYISDELVKLGHRIIHIFDEKRTQEHKLMKS